MQLEKNKAELEKVLQRILAETQAPRKKRFPSNYTPIIWKKLTGARITNWCTDSATNTISHCIRQIHDFYGWMAMTNTTKPNGGCAGALYRTREFMKIPPNQRDGSKKFSRNIHIEHTITVSDIKRILLARSDEMDSPSRVHQTILEHSVCVAMSHQEEINLKTGGAQISQNTNTNITKPFQRYEPLAIFGASKPKPFEVYNVVTGQRIDLHTFTISDHKETLAHATKVTCHGEDEISIYAFERFRSTDWEAKAHG